MKIILSPAKEMNLEDPIEEDWRISLASQVVLKTVQDLTVEELQKVTKVNEKQLEQVEEYRKSWNVPITYKPLSLYNGLAYRWLKKVAGWDQHPTYIREHVRILSALYGVLESEKGIKPYRLDVTMSLRVAGVSLKAYWKSQLATAFAQGEVVINLASDEFSSLLNQERYQWIEVEFYEKKDGNLKQHSTISKKGRGMMAGWMISCEITSVDAMKHFSLGGYSYDDDLSKANRLVFVKKV